MTPAWTVSFTPNAAKAFRKLPESEQRRVRAALARLLADDRNADIKKLKDVRPERWRLRVGDWRVIFTAHSESNTLVVHDVFPRQAGY